MKYDLHTIFKTANILAQRMSRSQAFRTAWSLAKHQSVEKVTGVLYGHRQAAFQHLANYPESSIRLHLTRESGNRYDKNAVAVTAEVMARANIRWVILKATQPPL